MVDYSHLDKTAMCASSGYYVGKKGSEVQIADGSGNLYGGGTQVSNSSGRLFQQGNALVLSNSSRNPGAAPTIAAGNFRFAMGSAACSLSCTVDTGLTTIYHLVASIAGKMANGKIATLDNPATPDATLYKASHATALRYAYVGGNAEFKIYGQQDQIYNNTLDPLAKRHRISWIACGI